jgi:hypothetical protein
MYAAIGVAILWRMTWSQCPAEALCISPAEPGGHSITDTALAYALPYEGMRIRVFYDRIASKSLRLTAPLLAHVLAHEIGHILQGVSRHSPTGVMKANWKARDYFDMTNRGLAFTEEDVQLLHLGLDARTARKLVAIR